MKQENFTGDDKKTYNVYIYLNCDGFSFYFFTKGIFIYIFKAEKIFEFELYENCN